MPAYTVDTMQGSQYLYQNPSISVEVSTRTCGVAVRIFDELWFWGNF